MSLARQFEMREQFTATTTRAPSRPLLPAPGSRLPLPAPPAAKAAAPTTATVEGRPIKCLTQAEQEDRRRLGLCYNCDEKFTRGHNRVCKRLFLLDGVEEDDDGATEEAAVDAAKEEAPMFSLQALAGVAFSDTHDATGGPARLRVPRRPAGFRQHPQLHLGGRSTSDGTASTTPPPPHGHGCHVLMVKS